MDEATDITLSLASGGTVILAITVNLFQLSDEDFAFVQELVKLIRGYGQESVDDA